MEPAPNILDFNNRYFSIKVNQINKSYFKKSMKKSLKLNIPARGFLNEQA
jgi:hypothetical protein